MILMIQLLMKVVIIIHYLDKIVHHNKINKIVLCQIQEVIK